MQATTMEVTSIMDPDDDREHVVLYVDDANYRPSTEVVEGVIQLMVTAGILDAPVEPRFDEGCDDDWDYDDWDVDDDDDEQQEGWPRGRLRLPVRVKLAGMSPQSTRMRVDSGLIGASERVPSSFLILDMRWDSPGASMAFNDCDLDGRPSPEEEMKPFMVAFTRTHAGFIKAVETLVGRKLAIGYFLECDI